MKYSGWDFLDHMVQACEELIEFLKDINSSDEFEADAKTRRAVTMCNIRKRVCENKYCMILYSKRGDFK